ncbi:MAG: LysE family translocator [Mangrovicoccus sp.]|nr:LysE family translocator [Mangrovicoccus sp.]
MSFDSWLAYVAAYAVLSLIPGPSVFMVLGQSLSRGLRAAFHCILGDLLGGIVVMCLAFAGLGAVLATSAVLYGAIKWAGVAYMAWLGVTQILAAKRTGSTAPEELGSKPQTKGSLRAGFLTGILNPKAILFYVAFLAQFMTPSAPILPQFLILMASSTAVVFVVLSGYALMAAQMRRKLHSLRARKMMGYAGGSFLLGGSAVMAAH